MELVTIFDQFRHFHPGSRKRKANMLISIREWAQYAIVYVQKYKRYHINLLWLVVFWQT